MTNQVQQSENRHDGAGSRKETRTADFSKTVLEPFLVFLRYPKEKLTEEDLMARFGVKRHVVRGGANPA